MSSKKRYNKSSRSKKRKMNKSIRKRNPIFFHRKIRGGADFGPASWNSSMSNPYTTYSQNDYVNDPSNPSIGNLSARNISGGRLRRLRRLKIMRGTKRKDQIKVLKSNSISLKGGDLTPISHMPAYSFGTFSGVPSSNILVNSTLPLSSAPYDNNNYPSTIV